MSRYQTLKKTTKEFKDIATDWRSILTVVNLMKARGIVRRLGKRFPDLLNQYSKVKFFWIAYSQDCEYAFVLYKDTTPSLT
jgi:hypothetical protein